MLKYEAIRRVFVSDELNKSEKMVLEWYLDSRDAGARLGGFFTKVFDAMGSADPINIERFRQGFPEEVEAFLAWTRGNLSNRVNDIAGEMVV